MGGEDEKHWFYANVKCTLYFLPKMFLVNFEKKSAFWHCLNFSWHNQLNLRVVVLIERCAFRKAMDLGLGKRKCVRVVGVMGTAPKRRGFWETDRPRTEQPRHNSIQPGTGRNTTKSNGPRKKWKALKYPKKIRPKPYMLIPLFWEQVMNSCPHCNLLI